MNWADYQDSLDTESHRANRMTKEEILDAMECLIPDFDRAKWGKKTERQLRQMMKPTN